MEEIIDHENMEGRPILIRWVSSTRSVSAALYNIIIFARYDNGQRL